MAALVDVRTWTGRHGRALLGAAVLAVVVWRLGTAPFVAAVRQVDGAAALTALVVTAVTTVCCAWRWRLVSHSLGVDVTIGAAVSGYYRSQFLNGVLPGGVLGDVHRGVRHGRPGGQVGPSLRAVAWERAAGQAVQVVATLVVVAVVPTPLRFWSLVALAVTGAVALAVAVVGRRGGPGPRWWARAVDRIRADLAGGLVSRQVWPGVVAASAVAVAGHVVVLVVAARAAGVTAPTLPLVPLALVVLLCTSLPLNVAGFGPREGGAGLVFAAAGLGGAVGVATGVLYGLITLVATSPGALVLLADRVHRGRAGPSSRPVATPPLTGQVLRG